MTAPQIGMTVRDKSFGGKYTVTIAAVSGDGRHVRVKWHNTIVTEEWPTEQINILS